MDNRLFRFHTAHVRSVRITGRHQSVPFEQKVSVKLALGCSKPKDHKYWTKNEFLLLCVDVGTGRLYEPPVAQHSFRHVVSVKFAPV